MQERRLAQGRTCPAMKTIPLLLSALAISPALLADDYTLFHVCQDQHIIHTSDGADAGHVEYLVFDPGSHRIVSTVVTGGVVGDRYIPVPFESMQFNSDHEILLSQVTRERIESAPVIERTQITSSAVLQPAIFERTSQHFGVRFDAQTNIREGERRDFQRTDMERRDNFRQESDLARREQANRNGVPASGGANGGGNLDRRDNDPARHEQENRNGATPGGRTNGEENRDRRNDPSRPGSVNRNEQDREGKAAAERNRPNSENTQDHKKDASEPPSGRSTTDKNNDNNQERSRQGQAAGTQEKQASERANAEKQSQQREGEKAKAHKPDPNAPPSGRAKPENEESAGGAAAQRKHAGENTDKEQSTPAAKRSQTESETPKTRPEKSSDNPGHAEKNNNGQERAKERSTEKAEGASEARATHKPAKPEGDEPKRKKQEN